MSKILRKLESIVWTYTPDPVERRLVRKLDLVILSFSCLAYFCLAIDVANLANAYVSGMKEDLGFVGNQYTLANSCWTAGYIVGQWPSAFALSSNRIPVRFWFSGCMLAWSVCTLGMAFVTSVHQVYALRFVQALFEASLFSGSHFVFGSWYKDIELGVRTAVFAASAQMGGLFSGIMQGAIVDTLGGRAGLKGWQWLFVLDFIITVVVAFYGLAMFPDTPQTSTAFWLSPEEKSLALTRLGARPPNRMTFGRIVTDWRWYLFSALFAISATSFEKTGVYSEFLLWLEYTGDYTTAQVNYYPSLFTAMSIVSTYGLTQFSNYTGNRAIINPIMFTAVTISSIMLLVWDIGKGGHFFAYIIAGLGYAGQSTNFAWANSMCRDDEVLRAVTLYSMNLFSNIWALWYGIAIWPVEDYPQFKKGQIATIVTGAFSLLIVGAIVWCSRHYLPNDDKYADEIEYNGQSVENVDEKDAEEIAGASLPSV